MTHDIHNSDHHRTRSPASQAQCASGNGGGIGGALLAGRLPGAHGDHDENHDTDVDSRSPSPALTVSNGPTSPPSISDSFVPLGGALTSLSNRGNSSTSSLPSTSGASNSSAAGPVPAPKAEVGFGSLHAEEELKKALSGKDRMFVLMLGKEFEAFIGRVTRGEYTARIPVSLPNSDIDLVPSKKIDVTATSKYHRMLTYKLAEWYGLRAVLGVDGSMVVGVLGTLDERGTTLKISTLVPEATAPQTQQFRIMQREAPSSVGDDDGVSRGTSVSGEDGTESSGPRGKTLEERTLAYALARKRIIGDDELRDDDNASSASQSRSRQASRFGDDDDELDPVPRRSYPPDFEYVYPSLYHPAQDSQPSLATPHGVPPPAISSGAPYGYAGMAPTYQGYMPQGMGYPDQRQYQMPAYPNAPYGGQVPMGGYGQQWQQPMGPGPGMMNVNSQMPGVMMPMVGQQGGWYPPDMGMAPPAPNMMPIIPQGMPYAPNYPYPQAGGPPLAQPTPMRPGMDPLSSTASSISSRSYQDVHSRPHSRGSTTSTRSAASSVRLGAIYPAGGQAFGFRQKAVKPPQGSFGSVKSMGFETTKRNGRQSPASTTSSRSSKRTSSIHITQPQPGQHPLPQRPDWAANNVPYHPSPMPLGSEPSTSDFPPLHRTSATNAEPMQVEKVKMRPPNGTVWNGARNFQAQGYASQAQETLADVHTTTSPMSILPNPNASQNAGKHVSVANPPAADVDPDFPRRMPSARTPSLYDPSAPRPTRQSPAPSAVHSVPATIVATPPAVSAPTSPAEVLSEDVIEARLAALSIKGVAIGPPPAGRQPSYAKIVRRD